MKTLQELETKIEQLDARFEESRKEFLILLRHACRTGLVLLWALLLGWLVSWILLLIWIVS